MQAAKFFILICNWGENLIYKTKVKQKSYKFSNFYTDILNMKRNLILYPLDIKNSRKKLSLFIIIFFKFHSFKQRPN